MNFFSKLCTLTVIACVYASPSVEQRAESAATNDWSKFLGKVPNYFAGPEAAGEAEAAAQAGAPADAQNDEIANDAGYPNPSQFTETQWQDKFKNCMSGYTQTASNAGSQSSGATGGGGGSQYGADQVSSYANAESFNQQFKKCQGDVTAAMGSYPGGNLAGQDYFNQFKPNFPSGFSPGFPSGFGSLTGSSSGSSAESSGSSAESSGSSAESSGSSGSYGSSASA